MSLDSLKLKIEQPTPNQVIRVRSFRNFRSFSEAARENADSRVKAGLHFRFATTAGLEMGRQIGQYVSRNALPRQHSAATQGE